MAWKAFEDPQAQFNEASLVLIGTPTGKDGKVEAYGIKAQTHLIEVEEVLKGDPITSPVQITSTPETCTTGSTYPNGDPLDTDKRLIIFADYHGDDWVTITPNYGTLSFDQGTELPFKK